MVDIHSHILWGLDDGAQTFDESIAMAHLAAESGTTDLVATPHANSRYPFDPQLIHERTAELQQSVGERLRLHAGTDFHLSFANIESALQDPRPYSINRSRYLLVELPEMLIPPEMGHVFERMRDIGILPIITHPERNRVLWQEEAMFDTWLESGCYVQITAQSLDGHFGRTAREIAWRLLDENKVHFVASDGHDTDFRPPRLDRAYAAIAKKHGAEIADRLLEENPKNVLQGTLIATGAYVRRSISRFRLFR
jgi:protein-tyrosine phosphatase